MASWARPGRGRSQAQSCVVLGPFDGVLESVVRLVHQVQDCRRTAHVRVRLTKESPVCRPELCLGCRWCDPENLVVRADGSQLALPGRYGESEPAGHQRAGSQHLGRDGVSMQ